MLPHMFSYMIRPTFPKIANNFTKWRFDFNLAVELGYEFKSVGKTQY